MSLHIDATNGVFGHGNRLPSGPRIDSAITSTNGARGRFGATRNALVPRPEPPPEGRGKAPAENPLRDAQAAMESAERAGDWIIRNMFAALRSHRGPLGERASKLLG